MKDKSNPELIKLQKTHIEIQRFTQITPNAELNPLPK